MPNGIELLLQALAGVPQVTSPLTPPFVPPNSTVPLTTAGQGGPGPTPNFTLPPPSAPIAPLGPQDSAFIANYAGPAPQAPAPLSRAQRIFNGIAGLGAGLQGNGAQFLEQLREPQRQYQRQVEQYQDRRTRGIELDDRRRERAQEAQTRQAEAQSEREFKQWMQRTGVQDEMALEKLRQAHEIEKEAKRARLETERELEREQRERVLDAKQKTSQFFTASKNMQLSRELGAHYAGLSDKPLSAAAARLDQQLQGVQQARMGRAVGGGGSRGSSGAALRAVQAFEARKQEVIQAVARGDVRSERLARRKLDAAVGQLARFPAEIEFGGDPQWPYAKLRNMQQAPGQQPQAANVKTIQQIRQLAAQAGISEQEAIQRAQAAGVQITQ